MQRKLCTRCLNSSATCYCREVQDIESNVRFVILQHPLERKRTVGSARMAHLCLRNSILISGTGKDFDADPRVLSLISDPSNHCAVLFPGPESVDLSGTRGDDWMPPKKNCSIFVIDGTWSCAKTMLRDSRVISSLPRICFTPTKSSEYGFRRQPHAHCLSTLEAIHHLLGILDPSVDASRLLILFRSMVSRQISFCSAR